MLILLQRFQSIFDCISDSLTNIKCRVGLITTTSTTAVAPPMAGWIITVYVLVFGFLLGAMCTCLVFCRKKRRPNRFGNVRFDANNQSRDKTEYHQYEAVPEIISEIQASRHSPDIPDRSQDRPQSCSTRIMELKMELDRLTEDVEDSPIDIVINVPEKGDGHYEPMTDPNKESDERQSFHAARPEPKQRPNLDDRKSSAQDLYIDASDNSVGHQSRRDIYIDAVEEIR